MPEAKVSWFANRLAAAANRSGILPKSTETVLRSAPSTSTALRSAPSTPIVKEATPQAQEHTEAPKPTGSKRLFKWEEGESERTTLFPIKHQDLWDFRKKIEKLHWTVEEVPIVRDKSDWALRMNESERHTMRYILGLFAVFDNLVLKNLPRFSEIVDCLEAQGFYSGQEDQETTHMEAYMLQIDAVAQDQKEKDYMLNSIKNMPGVKALVDWAKHWSNKSLSLEECFVAFMMIEGVIFSGFFCTIQVLLRDRNLCPAITDFNTFIMRDEGLHCLFATHITKKYMCNRPSQKRMRAIIKSGLAVASQMIDEAMPVPHVTTNAALAQAVREIPGGLHAAPVGLHPHLRGSQPVQIHGPSKPE